VIYAADAIATENPEAAEAVLRVLTREYRQRVLPLDEVLKLLKGS
jgi:hypothetical protein